MKIICLKQVKDLTFIFVNIIISKAISKYLKHVFAVILMKNSIPNDDNNNTILLQKIINYLKTLLRCLMRI